MINDGCLPKLDIKQKGWCAYYGGLCGKAGKGFDEAVCVGNFGQQ